MADARHYDCEQDPSIPINEDNKEVLVIGEISDPSRFMSLAMTSYNEFDNTGELENLEQVVNYTTQAISHAPRELQELPSWLGVLSFFLEARYEQLLDPVDLDTAIEYMIQEVSLMPESHSNTPARLNNLSYSLKSRFDRLGRLTDLDDAIKHTAHAVLLTPQGHPDIPTLFSYLGSLHEARFKRRGEIFDIDKAIDCSRRALSLTAPEDPDMPSRLNNMGYLLELQFKRLGDVADSEKAIEYYSQAIKATSDGHPDMPKWLSNLGTSLESRFSRVGDPSDLDKAIECTSQAVALTPEGHPDMPALLNSFGNSLDGRFKRLGERVDLDKAIECYTRVVLLTPHTHPDMPIWLNNLGYSHFSRFERSGQLADVDRAIEHTVEAISLTPEGHSDMPMRLNNLGNSLASRFKRLGELKDLDNAIQNTSRALFLTPQGHSDMPVLLNNLGCFLQNRFDHSGRLADLDKAIEYTSQSVSLTPRYHSSMPTWLNNLGFFPGTRFGKSGELSNLNQAIDCASRAVALTPQDHPNRPAQLNNLGYSLRSRFKKSGTLVDLEKAIEQHRQAVSLTPEGHPDMPIWLNGLGFAYKDRADLLGITRDIDQSIECFQRSADLPVGTPSDRFRSALQWARMCKNHCPASLVKAYQRAMSLLPQIVWLGSTVDSRYRQIEDLDNVTTEAAAAAIKMKDYEMALEWLEAGRSVVWKQMLQLRTPIDELAIVAPSLALELRQISRDLDRANAPKSMQYTAQSDMPSLEQVAQIHHRLAEKWERLLIEARSLPGFETFLLPQKASELMRSAQSGPVVLINLDKSSCDALIIQPNVAEVLHVPLDFSHDRAGYIRIQIDHLVRTRDLTSRYYIKQKTEPREDFGKTLTVLWTEVVKPVLVALGYTHARSTGDLPHITWCTTGPLSFLPLHAAGDYKSQSMIFNHVVSSYTPTLSTLLLPPATLSSFTGILAVGQSSNAGMASLPGTVEELVRIKEKSRGFDVTQLDGDLATPTAVLAGMEERSWVHLACHAMQNTTNPMHSAFYLHGGTLDLAAITQKQLKNADLAFLSACQTATGDKRLSEEAVHLAAGMLMAGYRTVIATMWSIGDEDAPLIAETVYEYLLEGGTPDARRAAMAVHMATERLRTKDVIACMGSAVTYFVIGVVLEVIHVEETEC